MKNNLKLLYNWKKDKTIPQKKAALLAAFSYIKLFF